MDFDDNDIFEDDLDVLEIIEFGFPRQVYIRNNPLENLSELDFFRRFRLYKATVRYLLTLIQEELEYPNNLNNAVSPINQLLTCLRLYATGGHLSSITDVVQMDVSTVSRIVVRVSNAIARLSQMFLQMPDHNQVVREQTKFYQIARFPRIIGVVDGTHVRIQSPGGEDAEIFRNRKSYFSINVQTTCNADLKFINVVARWPGSAHDSTIFNSSTLKARFEHGDFPNCFLLGDSGYPLRNYLLTPLLNPADHAQQLYNESLIRTRNCIERAIGVWKRRFPIMAYGARLKLETLLTIIISTAVLHNIAIEMNEPQPPPPDRINDNELNYLIDMGQIEIPQEVQDNRNIPQHVQQFIINYFANL